MKSEDRCAWKRCRQEGSHSGVMDNESRTYWLCHKHNATWNGQADRTRNPHFFTFVEGETFRLNADRVIAVFMVYRGRAE